MWTTLSRFGRAAAILIRTRVPFLRVKTVDGAVANQDTGSSAVVRKVGPHQWVVELLTPVSIPWHGEQRRGRWSIELYMEFETWEQALAKAVEWRIAGKVEHIICDDRDKEVG
jgi:hypothetical protein